MPEHHSKAELLHCAAQHFPLPSSSFLLNCTMRVVMISSDTWLPFMRNCETTHTGNKITNYLRPYLCSFEHHRKNLCSSVSLFMSLYFYVSLQKFFTIKFLFNFMISIFFRSLSFSHSFQPPTRTWPEIWYFCVRSTIR